jgi:hypothetical protein
LPKFGTVVWAFHPFAALKRVSQIAGSRLRSVPITVMDWTGVPASVRVLPGVPDVADRSVLLAAPVEAEDDHAGSDASDHDCTEEGAEEVRDQRKAGRTPVPDELYRGRLRELIAENEGVIPSIREVARQLSIGQDRARRLVSALK